MDCNMCYEHESKGDRHDGSCATDSVAGYRTAVPGIF